MTSRPDTMFTLENLQVSCRGKILLGGITTGVPAGGITMVIGPNGAGKTTLLKTLAGLATPSAGTITLNRSFSLGLSPPGSSATGSPSTQNLPDSFRAPAAMTTTERARSIGWCPDDIQIPFSYSLREVVVMGRFARHLGSPGRQDFQVADQYIDRLELGSCRDRPVTMLSRGERQRAMLARTLAAETPVLLLDEPTASLDSCHALDTLVLLQDISRSRTVVMTMHDINLACRFGSQVLALKHGTVHFSGPVAEVMLPAKLASLFDVRCHLAGAGERFPVFVFEPANGSPL